jgi:hypothetical protein
MKAIDSLRVSCMQWPECALERVFFGRHGDEMDVISHQTVRQDFDSCMLRAVAQAI